MAQVQAFYEPEKELLAVFWQSPRLSQLCTELGDGVIRIKDADSGEPIGIELLAYQSGNARFDSISVKIGATQSAA